MLFDLCCSGVCLLLMAVWQGLSFVVFAGFAVWCLVFADCCLLFVVVGSLLFAVVCFR